MLKRPRLLICPSTSTENLQEAAGRSGDLVLELASGEHIKVFSQLLLMTSPVFHDLLAACKGTGNLKVEGSKEAWHLLLQHLYPSYPRPEVTMGSARLMLPLAHRYDVVSVLSEIDACVSQQLPDQLSGDPESPCYVLKWLQLADDLQLDELKTLCMGRIKSMAMSSGQPKPTSCPHTPGSPGNVPLDFLLLAPACKNGPGCVSWCYNCRDWRCSQRPCSEGRCTSCRCALAVHAQAQWRTADQPKVLDSIKGLSRSTVDDLLASLMVGS